MRTSGPGQSALLLLDVVDLLNTKNIGYAVIGAMAASAHGVVRASLDADALLSLTTRELGDLEAAFKDGHFQTELRRGAHDDPIAALLAIGDSHDNRVDLLVGLRGMDSDAFSRTLEVPFRGVPLKIIGREDFIAMKLFAGGPQDLQDAQRAISIAGDKLDKDLLLRLTKGFGRDALNALQRIL